MTDTTGTLARVIDRYWLAVTDDCSVEDVSPEVTYKLGFANALQVVGFAKGRDREIRAAIREAVSLEVSHD